MSTTSFDAGCGTNISAGIGRSGERPAPSGNRRASMFWRGALCTSAECRRGKALGEPYDGKRHVRFDEGTLETEQWARLRHRHVAKAAGQQSSLALRPPRQRPTLQHRNLLAHAPERLHDEVTADYTDVIYAATRRGDRLFTFTRLPPSQWRSARTTNAIERFL